MNKLCRYIVGCLVLFLVLGKVSTVEAGKGETLDETISVYAAASLRDVLNEIGTRFEKEKSLRHPIAFNYGGSNELAHQIVATPGADIYLSANEEWMDFVDKHKRVITGSKKTLVTNQLVVVAHASTNYKIKGIEDLAKLPFKHLSIADPKAVPAGKYAKGYLSSVSVSGKSLWETLAPKVAPALDVRAALSLVETDPSVVGIVYRSDAKTSTKVRVLYKVPEEATPAVNYVVARINKKNSSAQSDAFYEYLFTKDSQEVFKRYGFAPVTAAKK